MSATVIKHRAQALLVLLTSMGFIPWVAAQENDSGPYIGAAYGEFNADIDNIEGLPAAIDSIDADDGAWKAFFGWRFNPYISAEIAYVDLGNPRGDFDSSGTFGDYTLELSGFGAYAIGTLPLGIFELSGKIGYYWHDVTWDVDWSNAGSGNGNVLNTSDSGSAVTYGVGAGVTLIDHINAKIEYELMDLDEVEDANVLWFTMAWRF